MRTYRVCGDRRVFGYGPGDVFEAEIPEAQEQRLLDRCALEVVDPKFQSGGVVPSPENEPAEDRGPLFGRFGASADDEGS